MKKRFFLQSFNYNKLVNWNNIENTNIKRLKNHVTIIIPVYNQSRLTGSCIHSIFHNTHEISFDVIVVDNHSTEDTRELLLQWAKKYKNLGSIKNRKNYGFGVGCNIGALGAEGEFLVFLNNDTEVFSQWLPPLIDPLKKDPGIGIVGPKLLFKNDTLQCGGVVFNNRSKIPYHIYKNFPKDHPAVNKQRYFQAFTGACFAIRAHDFYKIKGFSPIYLNGMEDIDLCFRVRKKLLKKILYNPNSSIYHLKGKTGGRGKFIVQNRKIFISNWSSEIVADDMKYYAEDGFIVKEYVTRETRLDKDLAQFYPKLEPVIT
jgi:GT2 family glycosyltransferase